MLRTVLAIAIVGLFFAALSATAQAAPTAIQECHDRAQYFIGCGLASLLARPLGSFALPPLLA
jgi:hypothetical protein